jgi:putative DNA primase/helicase
VRDIRRLIDGDEGKPGKFAGRAAIGSSELVDALTEDKAGRWAEFSHGKALTQRQLARLLRPFGIVPGTVRTEVDRTAKGYRSEDFNDAFARYTPPLDPSHRHKPVNTRVVTDLASDTREGALRIDDPSQASKYAGCDGVTDENPPVGGVERF